MGVGGGRGMADVGCSLGSEAGDAGSLPCTRSQVKVDYFINLYTSILLDCLICTRNVMPILLLLEMMGRWERYRDG